MLALVEGGWRSRPGRRSAPLRALPHAFLLDIAQQRQRHAVVRTHRLVPWQCAQALVVASIIPGAAAAGSSPATRSPGEIRPTRMRARSLFSFSFNRFSTAALLRRSSMSMKSMTMMARRVAQAHLPRRLLGRLEIGLEGGVLDRGLAVARPELTSIATSASVTSITIYPPTSS